jgi:hypothetical protein
MAGQAAQLQIPDRRNGGRHLRVSWHPAQRLVVFSHWREGVCVATTPVELDEIPSVIGALVGALAEGSASPTKEPSGPTAQSVGRDIGQMVSGWLRPRLASIVALKPRSEDQRR